jgi:hypothetical protein
LDVTLAQQNFAFDIENGHVAIFALCNGHTGPPK